MKINLLYISYWGIQDGLTQSTVLPNIDILQKLDNVESIVLLTIERNSQKVTPTRFGNKKVQHIPVYSPDLRPYLLNKTLDFVYFPIKIHQICKRYNVTHILARGAMAGTLAWMVSRLNNLPYFVESFEPHSAYMLQSGVWGLNDLRYKFQHYAENQQLRTADAIITVSDNYRTYLRSAAVPENKLFMIPCCVDLKQFEFSVADRNKIREKLSIKQNDITGIYVGKFGDIYYRDEAFDIISSAFTFFGSAYYQIILTPQPIAEIIQELEKRSVPINRVFVAKVAHHEVPEYLSASDFAFSFVKPAECRKYCSPVKDGEYWANGLPTLLANDIGDDSDIVTDENLGYVFDLSNEKLQLAFSHINSMIHSKSNLSRDQRIVQAALKHRGYHIAEDVYRKVFNSINTV